MAIITSATGHLVRMDLHDDGTLVLAPHNRVSALWLFGTPSTAPIYVTADIVASITDQLPSDDGVMLGWIVLATPGDALRVPYRLKAQPEVRYLLREACALGYPERVVIGQASLPEPVALVL